MTRDLSRHPELLAINHATVRRRCDLPTLVELCQRRGIRAIATWRDLLGEGGVAAAARLLRQAGLQVTGHCRAGLFAASSAAERAAILAENRRAIDEAAELGAQSLCVIAGGLPGGSRDLAAAHAEVHDGLGAMLEHARKAGVRLGLEPLHPMYAADRACDWLVPTRDFLTDRGMMGDGVIDIPRIRGMVEAAGYGGFVEVEIFSAENWWTRDPAEVIVTCMQRFASAC